MEEIEEQRKKLTKTLRFENHQKSIKDVIPSVSSKRNLSMKKK